MLSGVRDEVVPREHMQGLWEIVRKRTSGRKGRDAEERSEENGKTVHEIAGGAGNSKFVEFEQGTHNDTCVQQGYWSTIAEFVAGLNGDS